MYVQGCADNFFCAFSFFLRKLKSEGILHPLEDEPNQILKRWEPKAQAPTLQSGLGSINFIHYSEFLRWEPPALAPTLIIFD